MAKIRVRVSRGRRGAVHFGRCNWHWKITAGPDVSALMNSSDGYATSDIQSAQKMHARTELVPLRNVRSLRKRARSDQFAISTINNNCRSDVHQHWKSISG